MVRSLSLLACFALVACGNADSLQPVDTEVSISEPAIGWRTSTDGVVCGMINDQQQVGVVLTADSGGVSIMSPEINVESGEEYVVVFSDSTNVYSATGVRSTSGQSLIYVPFTDQSEFLYDFGISNKMVITAVKAKPGEHLSFDLTNAFQATEEFYDCAMSLLSASSINTGDAITINTKATA